MTSNTVYLPIELSDAIHPATVGVFTPTHFRPGAVVNLIVYFHGHIIDACQTDPDRFVEDGIEYYWGTPLFRALRDDLEASKVNAKLVAPTLTPRFGSSAESWTPRYGNLNEDGKFDFLISSILGGATAGNIILSGHSAGGMPMMRILSAKNKMGPHITECWGFECLYFGTDDWDTWLENNPAKQFRHFRRAGEFEAETEVLEQRDNFFDVKRGTDHCSLIKDNWRSAIAVSDTLQLGDVA